MVKITFLFQKNKQYDFSVLHRASFLFFRIDNIFLFLLKVNKNCYLYCAINTSLTHRMVMLFVIKEQIKQ